jgi:hypothetical protein
MTSERASSSSKGTCCTSAGRRPGLVGQNGQARGRFDRRRAKAAQAHDVHGQAVELDERKVPKAAVPRLGPAALADGLGVAPDVTADFQRQGDGGPPRPCRSWARWSPSPRGPWPRRRRRRRQAKTARASEVRAKISAVSLILLTKTSSTSRRRSAKSAKGVRSWTTVGPSRSKAAQERSPGLSAWASKTASGHGLSGRLDVKASVHLQPRRPRATDGAWEARGVEPAHDTPLGAENRSFLPGTTAQKRPRLVKWLARPLSRTGVRRAGRQAPGSSKIFGGRGRQTNNDFFTNGRAPGPPGDKKSNVFGLLAFQRLGG